MVLLVNQGGRFAGDKAFWNAEINDIEKLLAVLRPPMA